MLGRSLFGGLASVTLIDISQLDMFSRNLLHLLGQFAHLSAILLVGRCHMQGQQMPQRIDRRMTPEPLRRLAPS